MSLPQYPCHNVPATMSLPQCLYPNVPAPVPLFSPVLYGHPFASGISCFCIRSADDPHFLPFFSSLSCLHGNLCPTLPRTVSVMFLKVYRVVRMHNGPRRDNFCIKYILYFFIIYSIDTNSYILRRFIYNAISRCKRNVIQYLNCRCLQY